MVIVRLYSIFRYIKFNFIISCYLINASTFVEEILLFMERNKVEHIQIRCTQGEKEAIRLSAKNANLSMSEYLLRVNSKHFVYYSMLLKLIDEVAINDNKLDNNINQIARNFNTPNYVITDDSLKQLIYNLQKVEEKRENLIKNFQKIIKVISQ